MHAAVPSVQADLSARRDAGVRLAGRPSQRVMACGVHSGSGLCCILELPRAAIECVVRARCSVAKLDVFRADAPAARACAGERLAPCTCMHARIRHRRPSCWHVDT
jgi:hypothetical protein